MSVFPRYVAFCGVPKSGKSLAQEILLDNYGIEPIDDGAILREFAMKYLGATRDQVYTQEGKVSPAHWPNGDPMMNAQTGEHMTWRRVLGLLGNQLEAMFGKYVMPMTACAQLDGLPGPFSFGSVRRDQGMYYKNNGGIIVEIINPQAVPTGNEFDNYDASICDYHITNDALARGLSVEGSKKDLQAKLQMVVIDATTKKLAA